MKNLLDSMGTQIRHICMFHKILLILTWKIVIYISHIVVLGETILDLDCFIRYFRMSEHEPDSYSSHEVMPFDLSSDHHQDHSKKLSQGLLHLFHFLANQKNITSPDDSVNTDMHIR